MGELIDIVGSLENKVSRLLQKMEELNLSNRNLKEEVKSLETELQSNRNTLQNWEEKYDSLKMANVMLGSNTSKTEAKLKINTLIRELDVCIARLSE